MRGECVHRAEENVVLFLWVFCPQGSMDFVKVYIPHQDSIFVEFLL